MVLIPNLSIHWCCSPVYYTFCDTSRPMESMIATVPRSLWVAKWTSLCPKPILLERKWRNDKLRNFRVRNYICCQNTFWSQNRHLSVKVLWIWERHDVATPNMEVWKCLACLVPDGPDGWSFPDAQWELRRVYEVGWTHGARSLDVWCWESHLPWHELISEVSDNKILPS